MRQRAGTPVVGGTGLLWTGTDHDVRSLWTTPTVHPAGPARLDGMSELRVPGFDAVELLGYGSGGEVWLARDRATGSPVALKRLRAGADLAARDRLRREAAVLAGVDHPHVVRLRTVVGDGHGDGVVLVLDLASGGSLARLLATRRRLQPGEVVTLAVPLAQALAAVHAQGLVHGDVTPANVLFDADGRPLLSDLGVARLLGAGSGAPHGTRGYVDPAVLAGAQPGPASDVHGLAATCLAALTGTAPYDELGRRVPVPDGAHPGLVTVLERALAPDPWDRPAADELAVAVYDAVPAEPVHLDRAGAPAAAEAADVPQGAEAATHQVHPGPRPVDGEAVGAAVPRRRTASAAVRRLAGAVRSRGRSAVVVTVVGGALGLAAVTGIAWAGVGGTQQPAGLAGTAPTRAASPTPEPPTAELPATAELPGPAAGRWAVTLAGLDRARSKAFAAGEPSGLRAVYAPGSPALARDTRVLRRLAGAGLRAEGLRLTPTTVRPVGSSAGRVRLAVTDLMPAYRLVDAGGTVVERREGRGPRSWTVELAAVGHGWRVYDVVRG